VRIEVTVNRGWFHFSLNDHPQSPDHFPVRPIRRFPRRIKSTHVPFYNINTTRGEPDSLG
jgi:hypothetical protein